MRSNVVNLPVVTTLPLDPERVLQAALDYHQDTPFKRVMLIGFITDKDGDEHFYFSSSDPDGGTALWDMERAKHKLMQIADEAE